MGSKLAVLAAAVTVLGARPASAETAAEALKQGIDAYKAARYADAVVALKHAYELEAKPETLFALAQAERLSGDCVSASADYHKVIEQVGDFNVAKLVEQNLAICDKLLPKPKPEPVPEPKPAPPPPPPQIVTRTVVRDVTHTDVLAASLFAGGALGLGVAVGLGVAAAGNRNGAAKARTLDDYTTLADRADLEQKAMYLAGGVGVALIGVAVYRWISHDDGGSTDVAIVPSASGGAVWVTSRW